MPFNENLLWRIKNKTGVILPSVQYDQLTVEDIEILEALPLRTKEAVTRLALELTHL